MSEPQKFRKKPVVVEAIEYDGTPGTATPIIDWALDAGGSIRYWCADKEACRRGTHVLHVSTLEGMMTALPGDWIVRGTEGEFYPVKPAAFAATFEPVGSFLNPNAELCVDCGHVASGSAHVNNDRLCHPDNPTERDCYHLRILKGVSS